MGTGAESESEKVTLATDEHCTGLGLDWIRSIAIFLNLNWIRTVNFLKNLEPDRIWTELMEKKCDIFVVKRLHLKITLDFI